MSRIVRALLLGLFTTLFLLPVHVASAHDVLLESDPADGATLETAPEAMTLTFSGQISELGAQVSVTGGSGSGSLVAGAPRVEDARLVQDLADLGPGDYEVLWRVTSEDGHPISGSFSFEVEEGAAAPAPTDATEDADDAGDATEATQDAGGATGDESTAGATDAAAATQQPDETTTEATTDPATADSDAQAGQDADGGVPVWAWAVVGAAVVALIALLARTVLRTRN